MDSQLYFDSFNVAVAKSDNWGCTTADDFEPRTPPGTNLSHYADIVEEFIEKLGVHPVLRTNCAIIHWQLWKFLQLRGLPSFITVGDIRWSDRKCEFGASYTKLKQEWRGAYVGNSSSTIDYHVWLTLQDCMTIIDLTVLPYFEGKIEDDFVWKNYIYMTDYINFDEPIVHIPFLVGLDFLHRSGALRAAR